MEKELQKEILKESLKEWLDEKFATFGKWTLSAIVAIVFWAIVYFAFNVLDWRPL